MAEGRLFFALWPDAPARKRLASLAREFGPKGGRQHHPDDHHITLVFLGSVEASKQPCIYQVAERIVSEPIDLQLDTIGHWPRPKILWCGPSQAPEALERLVKDLQQGLLACGFEPERRRYKPHVTLHRKVRHADSGAIADPIEWQAREFVLATSGGNTPGAPRYRILHRWPLKPAASTDAPAPDQN
jgi:2'-5' RNA ligase